MLFKHLFKWCIRLTGKSKPGLAVASEKPRVLVIPYNAIGDMVMTAPLFTALKKAQPDWQLEVLCSSRNQDIIRYHPAIQRCWQVDLSLKPHRAWPQRAARKKLYAQQFDKIIYLEERIHWVALWRIHRLRAAEKLSLPFAQHLIEKKQIDPVRLGIFDRTIGSDYEQTPHFTRRMMSIVPALGGEIPHKMEYNLNLPHQKSGWGKILPAGERLLFNPCGTQNGNTLSSEQACSILAQLESLDIKVCVFDLPDVRQKLADYPHQERITYLASRSISQAGDLIREMSLVLTTDTSIGHISSALGITTFIMRSDEAWRANCDPLTDNICMLIAKNTLTTLSPELVLEQLQHFLSENKPAACA